MPRNANRQLQLVTIITYFCIIFLLFFVRNLNHISKPFFSLSCRLLGLIPTSNSSSTFSQFKFITDHYHAQRSKGRRYVDLWFRSAKSIQNFSCYEVCYLLSTYVIRTLATLQYPSVVWQITTKIHTRNPTLLNTAYSQGEEKDITVVGEPT